MSLISASEVFQFAVKIEENGEKFYRAFAKKLPNEREKEIFTFLADEEITHKNTFRDMLKTIEDYKPETSYPDEYYAYLQAYADNLIFTAGSLQQEVNSIKTAKEAAEFGIRRELDSILYYQEIKSFVPEKQRDLIDKIIDEERAHFLKLTDLKKEL